MSEQLLERCAAEIDAEHAPRRGVDIGDLQARIEEHQPVVDACEDSLAFLLLRDDLAYIQLVILLESRGHLVELFGKKSYLVRALDRDLDCVVPAGDLPRSLHQMAKWADHPLRQHETEDQSNQEGHRRDSHR